MLGRRSKTAVLEKEVSNAGSKAAETVSDLADRAVAAAGAAQRAATPVIRSAAQTSAGSLSQAAGKAAVVLSDTAEKLAVSGSERAGEASIVARHKLADASEAVAGAVRPKKKRHRIRKLVFVSAILGGIYVLLAKTPLKTKIADLAFGPPVEDEEPEPITLPSALPPTTDTETPSDAATGDQGLAAAGGDGPAPDAARTGDAKP